MNVLAAALILLVPLATPSAELDVMRRFGGADTERVAEVLAAGLDKLNGQTSAELCMDAFLAGELLRKADALAPGQGYADRAIERFRAMRVDYMDLSAGQLGYIGEARVHLQMGNPTEAIATLAPLLDSRAESKMRRLAKLEALEAELILDPRRALTQAGGLGAPADWVRARAYAATGDTEKALDYARRDTVISTVQTFDRLELIATLDALNTDERLVWASELSAVGRHEEALAVLDVEQTVASSRLHAELLQRAGRLDEALPRWRTALDNGADEQALFSYAACLEVMAEQTGPEDSDGFRIQAIRAYERAVASGQDDDLRRDALRRWFFLSGPEASPEAIAGYIELIQTDPYLRLARVHVLRDSLEIEEAIAELSLIIDKATWPSLKASAALLLAQIQTNPREALAVLNAHWDELMIENTTSGPAQHFRIELWMGLGMIDRASEQMLSDPGNQQAELLLMVGSALADRYTDGVVIDEPEHVLKLASAAMSRSPGDEDVALSAADLMLRVGARREATRVLASLKSPEALVLQAMVLRELGQVDEALDLLKSVDTPEAAIERCTCMIEQDRMEAAIIEARSARGGLPPGSDMWWRATLLLARTHIAMGEPVAASDVLRVSSALHPIGGRIGLNSELKVLEKELEE